MAKLDVVLPILTISVRFPFLFGKTPDFRFQKRNKSSRLSISEVMSIIIYFHQRPNQYHVGNGNKSQY
ncbi:hypothetical protein [Candidatus Enterovibrio escicola]|uniref:hypothetical protein n=1 Tax=Candidatus Enterovibrio escicola TaxID=1927127 RepID=UPI0011BA83AC|nr:hypothetical protein [Candidatus Enterovibrio escacola]